MVRELIRIEGVDRSFGPVDVLKDISFNVNDGDRIGIVGHNDVQLYADSEVSECTIPR